MVKKAFFKGFIFVIILMLLTIALNSLFIIKTNHRAQIIEGIYSDIKTPLDVVLMGSSHIQALINPNTLWKQFGITSYNYATGGQPIDVTYYMLKEVLKTHKNPIVVVDLYYLGSTDKFGTEGYVRTALDNIKFSINKVQAIINCTPTKDWLNYLFPIFKYHDRWKELTERDFIFDPAETYYQKGFGASHELYGKANTPSPSTTDTVDIPPNSEKYLNKIIDLSKTEGFKLIFTNAPHDLSQTAASNVWEKQPEKMFNKVAEISKINNIPFIDYNNMFNELGFNFKTDMVNAGHLNIFGAQKVTLDFGKYLKDNFILTDHRNDPAYKEWNSDYILNSHAEAAIDITGETDLKKYVSLIKNKNYIIVASSNDDISKNTVLKNALTQLGLKPNDQKNIGSNYLEVLNGAKIQSETLSSSKLTKEFAFDKDTNFKITTRSSDKNMPSILFNGVECLNKHPGLNIVVYDKSLKKIIDNIYLDSNNTIKR